jgi:hypothetical protein
VIAIPFAANLGTVAAIAGRTASPRCNQSGHEPPMIAIPATGYCGSLHIDLPLPLLHRCMACCFKVGFSALPPARSGGGNGTAVL